MVGTGFVNAGSRNEPCDSSGHRIQCSHGLLEPANEFVVFVAWDGEFNCFGHGMSLMRLVLSCPARGVWIMNRNLAAFPLSFGWQSRDGRMHRRNSRTLQVRSLDCGLCTRLVTREAQ